MKQMARTAQGKAAGRRTGRRTARRPSKAPRTAKPAQPYSGVAPGIQPISAYLAVKDVDASSAFLEQALGLTRGVVLTGPDGVARYAEMKHGASTVVLVPTGDRASASLGAAGLYTYVDDVDARLAAAAGAGAQTAPAEDMPWGDRVAAITDPDGYRWVLATFKKLAPFS